MNVVSDHIFTKTKSNALTSEEFAAFIQENGIDEFYIIGEDGDPELMAAQLCLPISVWINLCDREPERENEVMTLVERHIRRFFAVDEKKRERE